MKYIWMIFMYISAILMVYAGIQFIINSQLEITVIAIISSLLFMDGLLYIGFIYIKKHQWVHYLYGLFVLSNIVLSFTDDVGLIDILFVVVNVAQLIFFYLIYLKPNKISHRT